MTTIEQEDLADSFFAAPTLADDPLWYKDAVIYEVHVRAFRDSSGDGIGDFKGLTEKLDYLRDLGVTAIWVLPSTRPRSRTTDTTSPTTSASTPTTGRCAMSASSSARRTDAGCG